MELNKDAIRLIDRLYKDLYLDEQVLHYGTGNKYDKFNNIASYLSKLEITHNKVAESKHIGYLKKCYYDRYVIKREDIPESYYKNQEQMALDRGFGHINIDAKQKAQLQDEVIENQKKSLDTWIDYFLSDDAIVYPFWAKYWAFQGMLNLGYFDKEKNKFYKRTKGTVYPFCDLNREALAISIHLLIKGLNKETIDDKDLEILVKSGSFQKIYTYILTKILSDNKNIAKRNIGKWIKYNRGSDHMPLVNSLQGYNTGWCTAGEITAKTQLQGGDFYVYYTLDDNDEYKVPRIAIRMSYGFIGEIRGVAQNQNIEPDMEKVVEEKIKDFPDKDLYYKKVNDMKCLTEIYKKHQNNFELTKEELTFIYEIDNKIEGFGYDEDPRINEVIGERNKRKDLSYILDCKEEQIAFEHYELNIKDDIIYYEGGLIIYDDEMMIIPPKYIKGNITIFNEDLNHLIFPEFVSGCVSLYNYELKNVTFPKYVGENLELYNLRKGENLKFPQVIKGNLEANYLESVEGGLKLPERVEGYLHLNSLKSLKGIVLPDYIGGNLKLDGLESAEDLDLSNKIKNGVSLKSLKSAESLKLPEKINGNLNLSGLQSVEGLVLPKTVKGSLNLSGLQSAEGLVLPEYIEMSLYLNSLENAENLKLPKYVNGILHLENLKYVKDLTLTKFDGLGLVLDSLKSAGNLELPERIGDILELNNLEKVERLVLPKFSSENVYLFSLENVENLVIPEPLTYTIFMKGFYISPENVDEYRNKKKLT